METAMNILRNIVLALIVGGLLGWALTTRIPVHAAALGGTAAAAYMYGSLFVLDRGDRRENQARRTDDDEELG
jgi:Na+/citrate or Na+/malate symporter